jgi:hypothetical protein
MKRNRFVSPGLVALLVGFALLLLTVSARSAENGPAFAATGRPRAEGGAKAASIGTIIGRSGRRQVTYNRHPLYYYVGDQRPGETNGQGLNQFGALWYVLAPNGNAITRATPGAQTPSVGY